MVSFDRIKGFNTVETINKDIIFISDVLIPSYERMKIGKSSVNCSICNNEISSFRYKAMPSWDVSGDLCSKCYSRKLSEYYIKNQQEYNK